MHKNQGAGLTGIEAALTLDTKWSQNSDCITI
jgi:hypothetical protein